MKMLTRCTACKTAFRITAEQLAMRQGKVRCGECGTVFSAHEQLAQAEAEKVESLPGQDADIAALPASTSLSTPNLTTAEVVLHGLSATGNERSTAIGAEAESNDSTQVSTLTDAATRPPTGRRRWGSLSGSVIAMTLLGFQATYFYRDEIAARLPETKPWLERLCAQLSCKFDTPRDAQAISIESHDLQADPSNKSLLALVAVLRNRAGFVQDSPHLELTLTDAQDAPVTRRVLAPREYSTTAQVGAGAELQIRVLIDASQVKASGYRLYAFYP